MQEKDDCSINSCQGYQYIITYQVFTHVVVNVTYVHTYYSSYGENGNEMHRKIQIHTKQGY